MSRCLYKAMNIGKVKGTVCTTMRHCSLIPFRKGDCYEKNSINVGEFNTALGPGNNVPVHGTAHTRCYEPDLVPVGSEVLRDATLCVNTNDGVSAEIKAKGLTPGNAHTFWFAYVDQPSLCTGGGPGGVRPDSAAYSAIG